MIRFRLFRIVANNGGDDLTLNQGWAIVNSDDTNRVISILDNYRAEATPLGDHFGHITDGFGFFLAERNSVNPFIGNDDELHQVNGIGAFAQDAALWAALSAVSQETFHILKIMDGSIGRQHLGRFQLLTVTGKDISDLALRNGH